MVMAMEKKNIAFIGMMGCGKTTVSKMLSRVLTDYAYVDIDEEIEKNTGKKISEIFLKYGELHFRSLESEKIKRVCECEKQIISLGGGAFENPNTRVLLDKNALTIYLKASPQEIYNRIKEEVHRPLLRKNFSVEKIAEILEKRKRNYEKAAKIVYTDGKSPYCIVKEILEMLK